MLLENYNIDKIYIIRKPIINIIYNVMNVLTIDQLRQNLNDSSYDKLFHLYMIIKTNNDLYVMNEKNERLNIYIKNMNYNIYDDLTNEFKIIDLKNNNNIKLNIYKMLKNTFDKYGPNIFIYDAFKNNCQDYIISCLEANHLLTDELKKFILQDKTILLKNISENTKILTKGITNLGSLLNKLYTGSNIH